MMIKDKLIEIMQDNIGTVYPLKNGRVIPADGVEIVGFETAAMSIYNYLVESGMMIGRKWKGE